MMQPAAVAALVAAATASPLPTTPGDGPGAPFPESRLVTPAQGALLNSWAKMPAEKSWKLCYTTFGMDKTAAAFHKSCDQYKPTVTVAHNAGGRPGRCQGRWAYQDLRSGDDTIFCSPLGANCQDPAGGPPGPKCPDAGHGYGKCVGVCSLSDDQGDSHCSGLGSPCGPTNPGNFTFGGYADATWSGDRVLKGTSASFIFGLGPGAPEQISQPGQWVGGSFFPAWGGATSIPGLPNANGLWIGGTSMYNPDGGGEAPGSPDGFCGGFAGYPLRREGLCGGGGNWGETELEVWRPVCRTAADCDAHQSCDVADGSCRCESGWSGPGCATCSKKHFCSGRGSCVLYPPTTPQLCHCDAGYSGADCSTFAGSPLFPETKIVSPEWGTALDSMTHRSGVPAGQVWKLCYSSDTMNKTTAEFHKRCDQYNKTLTVAHNSLGPGSSGTLGRPDSLIGRTFGGFVRSCMPLTQFSCLSVPLDTGTVPTSRARPVLVLCSSRSDLPLAP